jgi:hypothetical protein
MRCCAAAVAWLQRALFRRRFCAEQVLQRPQALARFGGLSCLGLPLQLAVLLLQLHHLPGQDGTDRQDL